MKRSRNPMLLGTLAVALTLMLGAAAASRAAGPAEEELELCANCHEELVQSFRTTTHGKLRAFELHGAAGGCTACHGAGTAHAEAGGDAELIGKIDAEAPVDEVSVICLKCHKSEALHDWAGSTHALNDVGCTDCHHPHRPPKKEIRDPKVCFDCHQDVRSAFQYPSHHPLREGHMRCSSCHTPHGASIGLVRNDESLNDLCLECHTHLQGPFIFEHEPVFEGCDTCHTPHGSVANKLLLQNEPFICLQCHEFHFHSGLEGEPGRTSFVPRFDDGQSPLPSDGQTYPGGMVPNPWREAGYKRAFTTKCTQCHTHVHGTDLPAQTVPGLGRGLTR